MLGRALVGVVEGEADPRDQEGDGEHDADVEEVDEPIERVSGSVLAWDVAT